MRTITRRAWLQQATLAAAPRLWSTPASGTLVVSPDGRDSAAGTADAPKATLVGARDSLRTLSPGARKRIVVRGGDYFLSEPLVLDHRDSGLVIEAAPGDQPLLHGGRLIAGWTPDGDRFWSAPVGSDADFRMLLVNRRYCPRARLPEVGAFRHKSEFPVRWMSTTEGGWERQPTEDELTTMRFRPEDLGPWFDSRNAEVRVYHMWDESLVPVASIDHSDHVMRFASRTGHPPGAFGVDKYVVWNVREGMNVPGQWYLDRVAGRVVYWPLPGEKMAEAEVIAPVLRSIVRLEGSETEPVRDIAISGLGLSVTNTEAGSGGFGAARYSGALWASHVENCELLDLTVNHVCGQAVKARACRALRISGCSAHSCGAGGLRIRGHSIIIEDNRIHDVGLTYPSAIALSLDGDNGRIEHNSIYRAPYSAVTARGGPHSIARNHIHHVMEELHDGAGIYVAFCRQTGLQGNRVHDIPDTGGYGSSAYYLDEQAEECTVTGNVSVNVERPSHNHMARNNAILGNLFVSEGDMRLSFQRSGGYFLEHNVAEAHGKITVADAGAIARSKNNIFRSDSRVLEGVPENTLIADPKLERTGPGRFTFAPGSPAPGLGIAPIDVSDAGCREPR